MFEKTLLAAFSVSCCFFFRPTSAANAEPQLTVKLRQTPALTLPPKPAPDLRKAAHINELIKSLVNLNKGDFGLSDTLSGSAFSPVGEQINAGPSFLTNHTVEPSGSIKELVELGSDALPFLVDALDDKTPTKLVIRHDDMPGLMWLGQELPINPVNPAERGIAALPEADPFDKPLKRYTVKVGDVCFVAIGQIVGRAYHAVRYQPTACVVLSSPTSDSAFSAKVRGIWKSDDARRKLFDSLLADYCTDGIYNGDSLDGWGDGSAFQCSAALRMLFYFPDETEVLIANRLDKLDVANDATIDDYVRRCVANGVISDEFIRSVAWSSRPIIRASLESVFRRAGDIRCLLAALPAVTDKELLRKRLEGELSALSFDTPLHKNGAQLLLKAIVDRIPEDSRSAVTGFLKDRTAERCAIACSVVDGGALSWDIEELYPMLSDTRTCGWTYGPIPGTSDRLPIRVCDKAAEVLSHNHSELHFKMLGQHSDLDRQIATMKQTLAQRKVNPKH